MSGGGGSGGGLGLSVKQSSITFSLGVGDMRNTAEVVWFAEVSGAMSVRLGKRKMAGCVLASSHKYHWSELLSTYKRMFPSCVWRSYVSRRAT